MRCEINERKGTTFWQSLKRNGMPIKTILRYVEVYKVSNDISFEALVEAIAEKMSPYSDRQVMIEEAIEERERQESIS